MGGQDSGRTIITTDDWMRRVEKRAQHEERRPLIRNAADLLGPGIGPNASEIQDWNDEATLFNGFFFSEPGALHTPDPSRYWMGYTVMNTNGYGYQRVYEYRGGVDPAVVNTYVRTVSTLPGQGPQYGPWVVVAGGAAGGTDEVWLGPSQPADTLELWVDTDDPTGSVANTWVAPTLLNGWSNYSPAFTSAGYTKDLSGFVHLRGLIKGGTTASPFFILPTGFMPALTCLYNQIAGPGTARVDVVGAGSPQVNTYLGTGNNSYVSLDGITFWPDGP